MLNVTQKHKEMSGSPLVSSDSLPTSAVDSEIRSLRDTELLSRTKSLVSRERELTALVIRHLEEIERRKLYADLRYPSLFAYATAELKYSSSAAGRRIDAMRLVKEIPEVEAKIESGALSLSSISQAQTYFRDVRRAEPERALRAAEKLAVLAQLENKSSREAERLLLSITPVADHSKEARRQPFETASGYTMAIHGSVSDASEATPHAGSESARRTRYIPQAVKHAAWKRAGGQCVPRWTFWRSNEILSLGGKSKDERSAPP